MNFYSQYGQDNFIYENYFKDKSKGFFVDIGAFDGVDCSNTFLFENLGWRGYCFEPHPDHFSKLLENRPKSMCWPFAIGAETKKESFTVLRGYTTMLSGLTKAYDPRHTARIDAELQEHGGSKEIIEVEVYQLKDLLPPGHTIDYLSIDTEGGEASILKNVLESFTPLVISVEANNEQARLDLFSILSPLYNHELNLGCDLIFKLKNAN